MESGIETMRLRREFRPESSGEVRGRVGIVPLKSGLVPLYEVELEAVDMMAFDVVVAVDPGTVTAFAVVESDDTDVRELSVNSAGERVEVEIETSGS
jgi:hypothetical protein